MTRTRDFHRFHRWTAKLRRRSLRPHRRLVWLAAYPLTLLSCAAAAMQDALAALKAGRTPERMLEFAELRELVGFDRYDALLTVSDEV